MLCRSAAAANLVMRNPTRGAGARCASLESFAAARVAANRSELITGPTRAVLDGVRLQRLGERLPQERIGGLDQDRADRSAAVGDDPAVVADELRLVVAVEHLGGDPFVGPVAVRSCFFGADEQRWQDLEPRALITTRSEHVA